MGNEVQQKIDGDISSDTSSDKTRLRTATRRLAVAVVALLCVFAAPALMHRAFGATGVWGAGQYGYLDGLVCSSGPSSSPLASWDFGAGASPAFLTEGVSSNGATDSMRLPFPTAGSQLKSAVSAGQYGLSAAELATYAQLFTLYGINGDQHAAEVAALLLGRTDPANAPACAGDGDSAALLQRASSLAGPYTVKVTPITTPIVMGQPDNLTIAVTSANGTPVPAATVTLATTNGQLAPTATTDASGTATAGLVIPAGSPTQVVTVTASVTVSVGLDAVTAPSAPSPTNPSGHVATAVYPALPTAYAGTVDIPIDQSAQPAITATANVKALLIGHPFTPSASVTGLRGHSGTVTFSVSGPESFSGTACSTLSTESAGGAITSTASIVGDGPVQGQPFTPSTPGCYSVRASILTSDASPPSGAMSNAVTVVAIATTARIDVSRPVVGVGPFTASVTVKDSLGAKATVHATRTGPITTSANCSSIDWSSAPTQVIAAADTITGDGLVDVATAVMSAGCYQLAGTLTVDLGRFGTVDVPLTASATDSADVVVVAPVATETSDQVWAISPGPVPTHVTVAGTYGQAAHVQIRMYYSPDYRDGCAAADWSTATVVATGPRVAVTTTDQPVGVASGPTPRLGCYAPVPVVTMDANTSVTAAGLVGARYTMLVAGIDPNRKQTFTPLAEPASSTELPLKVTAVGVSVLLLAAVTAALAVGVATRRYEDGSGSPLFNEQD